MRGYGNSGLHFDWAGVGAVASIFFTYWEQHFKIILLMAFGCVFVRQEKTIDPPQRTQYLAYCLSTLAMQVHVYVHTYDTRW